MALIDVEVIDSQGNRCPTALNLINFTVSGPVEWRGGIAQGPDNYILSKTLPVEGGTNRVLIRTLPVAGRISITAMSANLKEATVQLNSKSVSVTDGLSLELLGSNLPSYLQRGPTPRPAIFPATRRAIDVAKASAGSNSEKVAATFDDDGTTDWSSDGTLKSAWIKNEFSRPGIVSEVVLKLVAWRTQSYPVRIWVDDKVVFTGTTERSLGYVTIGFKPTSGKSLKIDLVGAANNRDAYGNIIEIPGTPDPNSAADRKTNKDLLGIVEIEIYQNVGSKR